MKSPALLFGLRKIGPKKALGQNFLADPSIPEMIVRKADIGQDDVIIEVGAGFGALTAPLAKAAGKVYTYEIDGRLIELLQMELEGFSNVEVRNENFLKVDVFELARKLGAKLVIMGNLPYHISSPILIQLLSARQVVKKAVFMFQKELGLRLAAQPGCRQYGRITAMLAYCTDIRTLATVKSTAFYPRPKIDSIVLDIAFKEPVQKAENEQLLYKVIKAGFGKRRKTLRNALAGSALGIDPGTAVKCLKTADIDPVRRAETLNISEFVRLSDVLGQISPAIIDKP